MSVKANDHGRTKYHRTIHDWQGDQSIVVDVYCVQEAFAVTCPARQHVLKKLLCAGLRGKGDVMQDLQEAKVALDRAIVLEQARIASTKRLAGTSVGAVPGWKVIEVTDSDKGVVGYRVGWFDPPKPTFLVAHAYMAGKETGPSLGWCQNAAESHAKRFEEEKKTPWEFEEYQRQQGQN